MSRTSPLLSTPTPTLTASSSSSSTTVVPSAPSGYFVPSYPDSSLSPPRSTSTTPYSARTGTPPNGRGPSPTPSPSTLPQLGRTPPSANGTGPGASRTMLRVNTDTTSRARSNSAQPSSSTQAYFALSPAGQGYQHQVSHSGSTPSPTSGGPGSAGSSNAPHPFHHQMSKSLSYAPISPTPLSMSTTSAADPADTVYTGSGDGVSSKYSSGSTLRPVSPAGYHVPGAGPGIDASGIESATMKLIHRALDSSTDHGETLDLSRHKLEKIGEDEVEMFRRGVGKGRKGVWRLALSYNSLRDASIASSFARLDRLRYLNLKGNNFTSFPAPLTQLHALEILDLSKNAIDAFPDQPGRLVNLKVLSLSHNTIYTLPAYLTEFTSLKVLKVDHNPIEWPPKEVLGPLIDSEIGTKRLPGGPAGDGSDKGRRDDDLRPWIENMKSWMRTKSSETERLIERNRTDDDAYLASEEEPSSAVSNPRTPWNDAEPMSAIGEPPNDSILNGHSSSRDAPPVQRHRAATVSEDSLIRPNGSTLSLPSVRHDRSVSSSSFTPPASASTASSHSRQASSAGLSTGPLQQHQYMQEEEELASSMSSTSASAATPENGGNAAPALAGHTRGASYHTVNRLSANLTAKKSLPDLRLSHAKIIEGRRGDEESRPLGLGIVANKSRHKGEKSWGENQLVSSPSGTGVGSNAMAAKLARLGLNQPAGQGDLTKRSSQDTPLVDESRNSYFRRLSMLPASTISKAVAPVLLRFVDAIRGILFALTQLHSALRQFLLFAVDDRVAGLFARVMEPASTYLTNLINALDRFDSVSRRSAPPVHAVRGVVDTTKESIAVFGKVVAVLRMQVAALKDADVRYTRQLLLNVYGSMAEVVCSWKEMEPLLSDVRPLLGDGPGLAAQPTSQGQMVGPLQTPAQARLLSQKMVSSNSLSGRTPISPIPERGESHSPESVVRSGASNPTPSSNGPASGGGGGGGRAPSPLHQVVESPIATAMRGKNRRQAGSFSTEDVEKGMLMGSPGAKDGSGRGGAESEVIIERPEGEEEDEEDDGSEPRERDMAYEDGDYAPAMVPTFSQQSSRRAGGGGSHKPSSSMGSGVHTLSSAYGGGGGGGGGGRKLSVDVRPPTPASATLFDDDLLDVIETATEIAFTVWLRLAEDIGGTASLPAHAKSDSASSASSVTSRGGGVHLGAPSPLTPVDPASSAVSAATSASRKIPPRTRTELVNLLSHAEQVTTSLRESTMALRANPLTNFAATSLPDDAQSFIKTVVRVSELVKAISAAHTFAPAVRHSLSRLTQATRECAILLQVSSLRPGSATPGPGAMGSAGLAMGQGQQGAYGYHHQQPGSARSHSPSASRHHPHYHQSTTSDDYSGGGWPQLQVQVQPSHQQAYQSREVSGGGGGGGGATSGLRGLQLPTRQAALGRSRAVSGSNAVASPASAGGVGSPPSAEPGINRFTREAEFAPRRLQPSH